MEDITDADYAYKKSLLEFAMKNLGEYHDLDIQSDASLLGDVLEHFQNMGLEIYELDPARFLTAPRLARKATLKKM